MHATGSWAHRQPPSAVQPPPQSPPKTGGGGGGVWMESGTVDCFPEQQAGEAAPGPGRGAEKAAGEREGRGHT